MKAKQYQAEGLLLLSHCGYSFMEDLVAVAQQLGVESYILSSQPASQNELRAAELNRLVQWVKVMEKNALDYIDISHAVNELHQSGKKVLACISVWEGYRAHMAQANQELRVKDLDPKKIQLLLDKFTLRRKLNDLKLSGVSTELLDEVSFSSLRKSGQKKFIKPRTGIASYAAFKMNEHITWEKLAAISQEIQGDYEYASFFNNNLSFVAEDYIEGKEFSFEIIALNSVPYVLAIHEKIDLLEENETTLEGGCISPTTSLTPPEILTAKSWLNTVFEQLGLDRGCFHVEAKHDNGQWEVIEINPRVGGAYISRSVQTLTGKSLLMLWADCLLSEEETFANELKSLDAYPNGHFKGDYGTFFRVFFAKPNNRIQEINIKKIEKEPENLKIFLRSGVQVPNKAREIFLAQAFWEHAIRHHHETVSFLREKSQNCIEVIYA